MATITYSLKIGCGYIKAVSREYKFDEYIHSENWYVTEFIDSALYNDTVTAFWNTDNGWVFYRIGNHPNIAAFACSFPASEYTNEKLFNNFAGELINGATIPEFDSIETNLFEINNE